MTPCNHCGGDIAIVYPVGNCDHLYYPDNCEVCKKEQKKDAPLNLAELEKFVEEEGVIIMSDGSGFCNIYSDDSGWDYTKHTNPVTALVELYWKLRGGVRGNG